MDMNVCGFNTGPSHWVVFIDKAVPHIVYLHPGQGWIQGGGLGSFKLEVVRGKKTITEAILSPISDIILSGQAPHPSLQKS